MTTATLERTKTATTDFTFNRRVESDRDALWTRTGPSYNPETGVFDGPDIAYETSVRKIVRKRIEKTIRNWVKQPNAKQLFAMIEDITSAAMAQIHLFLSPTYTCRKLDNGQTEFEGCRTFIRGGKYYLLYSIERKYVEPRIEDGALGHLGYWVNRLRTIESDSPDELFRRIVYRAVHLVIQEHKGTTLQFNRLMSKDHHKTLSAAIAANELRQKAHSQQFTNETPQIEDEINWDSAFPISPRGKFEPIRAWKIRCKKQRDAKAKGLRVFRDICRAKLDGIPLTNTQRTQLRRLKDHFIDSQFVPVRDSVENVKMSALAFPKRQIIKEGFEGWKQHIKEHGLYNHSFWFAYMRTPCRMYLVK